MVEMVRDLVERMSGGRSDIAEICCRAAGDDESVGDGCATDGGAEITQEEAGLLREFPAIAAFADDGAEAETLDAPFVIRNGRIYTRRNWMVNGR